MKKGTLFLFFAIVLLGGGIALTAAFQDRTLSFVPPFAKFPAVLKIEGQRSEMEVSPQSTVYDLMLQAQEETDFTFSGREFAGIGFFVEEINKKRQSNKERKYWIYSINGKKAMVGVSQYIVEPYDIITWNYEDQETY
jgi:hypothetical protein